MYNKFKSFKSNITVEKAVIFSIISVLAFILFYCLILNPVLGKADNGDFGRMYSLSGLSDMGQTYNDQYDGYFHKIYRIVTPGILLPWYPNVMSGCYITKVAVILNFILCSTKLGFFDIRILAAIYSIIFITGIYLILKYNKLRLPAKIICGILAILVFTDGVYISYFNSFFGEATTISFMFLCIGSFFYLISRKEPNKYHFIFFFVSSLFFLTSKTQELPLLIFMWIIYFALYKFYEGYKKLIFKFTIAITVICAIAYVSISDYTNKNNIYQAVFTGIIYDSKTPNYDLKELGLDPKFASLAGTEFDTEDLAYDPVGETMLNEFYPNISMGKVLKFYIAHPDRAFEKICVSADFAYSLYDIDEHNYPKGEYNSNKFVNSFRVNLINKYPSIHRNIYIFICFSAIYLLVLIAYFFKTKKREVKLLTLMLLFILACGASQLVLPVLGSGLGDFGKHLFLINLSYDILVCSAIVWIVNIISKGVVKGYCAFK